LRRFLFRGKFLTMELLNGRAIAKKILNELKENIAKSRVIPGLVVIMVGNNKASDLYVKLKAKAAARVGIQFRLHKFSTQTKEAEIIKLIDKLNKKTDISGIIVQLPLPRRFDTQKIINSISPQKDADGFHPTNIKSFLSGRKDVFPVFPLAIITILKSIKFNFEGKKSAVICNSRVFGQTVGMALRREGIISKYILKKDFSRRKDDIKNADIIITAVGEPALISRPTVKNGAIVIDGGITRKKGGTQGDADPSSISNKAAYLSPVPNGVGPVTIACLLKNVHKLALRRKKYPTERI